MSNLDQFVKGAPPPGTTLSIPTTTSPTIKAEDVESTILSDPLASLPSSPPQIYLNLLILEASLRAQWLQLRTRRRQHTFFLTILGLWILYFTYALFLAPREDGSGVGGSVYWVVEVMEKVCLLGGGITAILIWGTGQWERGVKWPRRWVYNTNRGLRGFNCKLVVIKRAWWRDFLSTLRFYFSYGLFSSRSGSSYRFVDQGVLRESEKAQRGNGGHHALPGVGEDDEMTGYEEDLAPGGDYIKLLLLPKPFSPNFRENWDVYRTEYWEKENERRGILRTAMKAQDLNLAKQQGGWLWWTGYRGWKRGKAHDIEKTHHQHAHHKHINEKDQKRIRSGSIRSTSHSRNSSRSTTPTLETEDGPMGGHARRGSTASNASIGRRKKAVPGTAQRKLASGSSSATPEIPSPLVRENSFTSISSLDVEDDETKKSPRTMARSGPNRKPASGRSSK